MARNVKKTSYAYIHKLSAGVALLCFAVILVAGLQARVSVFTIAYRSLVSIIVVSVVSRIVVSILATSEEMNSGNEA